MSRKSSQLVKPGTGSSGKLGAAVVTVLVLVIVVQNPHASGEVLAHVFDSLQNFARSLNRGGR